MFAIFSTIYGVEHRLDSIEASSLEEAIELFQFFYGIDSDKVGSVKPDGRYRFVDSSGNSSNVSYDLPL